MNKLKYQYFRLYLLSAWITLSGALFAQPQKQPVDTSVYAKWPAVYWGGTTTNGHYGCYTIQNQPIGGSTIVVKTMQRGWERRFTGAKSCAFAADNETYLLLQNDSLLIGGLGKIGGIYLTGVASFRLLNKGEHNNWLVYKLKDNTESIVVRDLQTGTERKYSDVQNYWPGNNGKTMVLQVSKKAPELQWLNLDNGETQKIWTGKIKGGVVFDETDSQLSFLGQDISTISSARFYYYKEGSNQAVNLTDGLDSRYAIVAVRSISPKGRIILSLQEKNNEKTKLKPLFVPVDIYSYKDPRLQSEQIISAAKSPPYYSAVYTLQDKRMIFLENKGQQLLGASGRISDQSTYVLVRKYNDDGNGAGFGEWNWNLHDCFTVYLLSLKDGSFRPVCKALIGVNSAFNLFKLSPDGKYVIWYDPNKHNYFGCEIKGGTVVNLTGTTHTIWTTFDKDDEPDAYTLPIGIAGFLKDNSGLLIYDQYDIYQISFDDKKQPVCLTNGYGKQHQITFRLFDVDYGHDNIVNTNKRVVVDAFNRATKDDGFYRVCIGKQQIPERLYSGPYIFDGPTESKEVDRSRPIPAGDSSGYIVRRMSTLDAPNWFLTKDFRMFKPLTDLYPEKQFNWLTSEQVTWRTSDGKIDQGILYKPENFDPKKKYPMIVNYYEKKSELLHAYNKPDYSSPEINIPDYVTNGYLVFVPDIHFKVGSPGKSSLGCVVSGVNYLLKRRYIDAKRIGLQGHSWGGFQTNYIVTHSRLFAAAVAGSGMTDLVSIYGSIVGDGTSRQRQYELSRDRMGATLWQISQQYIENSPVLHADRVTTPLLMLADKGDGDVPYQQGIELFTALRRLDKKAWMLQYDGMGHILEGEAAKDYSLRMRQFFDYYLKGALPPVWMTRGIPASLKGATTGLEYDYSGQTP